MRNVNKINQNAHAKTNRINQILKNRNIVNWYTKCTLPQQMPKLINQTYLIYI